MFGRAEMTNNSKEQQLNLETTAAEARQTAAADRGGGLQMNRREPRALAELKGGGEPSFKKGCVVAGSPMPQNPNTACLKRDR